MKTRLLLLFVWMNISDLWAQDLTFATIKSGSSLKDVLTTTDIFLYPQFINSKVTFRDGTKSMAMMNYNSLSDEMLFINPTGDTLALKDEMTIKFISNDKDTFFYHEGYLRLVASNSALKLAVRQIWELADIRKIGSHNRPATTYGVSSYRTLTDVFGKTHDLILNEDVVLRKKANYFFGDMYNLFTPASKKNLLQLFSKDQDKLSNYLKEKNVKFDKKDDLEKLTQFLGQNL